MTTAHPHTTPPAARAAHGAQAAPSRWATGWARYRSHLAHRYRALDPALRHDLFPAAVRATRPLVVAEALLLVMIGFSLDDLHVLRVPGFLFGMIAAVVVLMVGGLLHGAAWTARLRDLDEQRLGAALERRRAFGRGLVTIVAFAFVAWLFLFSSGVPVWSA